MTKRKDRTLKIDERLLDAIARLAKKANMTPNRYMEHVLFDHSKAAGELPADAVPLGETRGNKKKAA